MSDATRRPDLSGRTLEACLEPAIAEGGDKSAAARTVLALATACIGISDLIALGPLAGSLGAVTGGANADGDEQKELDVQANDLILAALAGTATAFYASEEEDAIMTLDPAGSIAVAVDPLDGSSNIDANVSIGTIFSVMPASPDGASASFFRPGRDQLAAGYVIYGPHTALVLTIGDGVGLFILDPASRQFVKARTNLAIPVSTREYAINASNYRHWTNPIRLFIDDCIAGSEGPRGRDFNMRWVASLVAETHRIFSRGGVFLYPADNRPGYQSGRLRLIYEAAPIAFLAEQAGGAATDGTAPILDKIPTTLHERTPLIFGSLEKVNRITGYHVDPAFERSVSPLFEQRGLFRA
ncbi:class 1 fructose-bisphosphatase [Roseibium sp.]|uniref:class 1 fructose-bisphosphatase n=1 Tax=Roseibium sp. TaxID=1936156 RepID=UPI003A987CDA